MERIGRGSGAVLVGWCKCRRPWKLRIYGAEWGGLVPHRASCAWVRKGPMTGSRVFYASTSPRAIYGSSKRHSIVEPSFPGRERLLFGVLWGFGLGHLGLWI